MEKFISHTGQCVPLRRSDVDTDQIIPAKYLKRVSRTGFADALFAGWRSDPEFVLNVPSYSGATILIAGESFGIGSSREHAVWALQDYGFRVVISPSFGDIFRGNSLKNGLLTVAIPAPFVDALSDTVEANPKTDVEIDLSTCRVRYCDIDLPFELDEYARFRLMEGLDDIDMTLRHSDHIEEYEARRLPHLPKTLIS